MSQEAAFREIRRTPRDAAEEGTARKETEVKLPRKEVPDGRSRKLGARAWEGWTYRRKKAPDDGRTQRVGPRAMWPESNVWARKQSVGLKATLGRQKQNGAVGEKEQRRHIYHRRWRSRTTEEEEVGEEVGDAEGRATGNGRQLLTEVAAGWSGRCVCARHADYTEDGSAEAATGNSSVDNMDMPEEEIQRRPEGGRRGVVGG